MIETVEVENFQSHDNNVLEFSPGVNVIKGRSHSGKSSIIRAIRWALLNKPRGDHFISHFIKKKQVSSSAIAFTDGGYVIRKKGTSTNEYQTDQGTYKAMRSDVPDEVQETTQMNEINVQTQAEPYFMLTQTAGQVAKELNRLVGLDIIDSTLGKLNQVENEAGAKLNVLEMSIDKDSQELEDLSFVDDLEVRVVEVEQLWEQYNKLLAQKSSLIDAQEKLHDFEADIKETNEWLSIEEPYKEIRKLMDDRKGLLGTLYQLKKLYDDLQYAEKTRLTLDRHVGQLINKRFELLKKHQHEFCRYCGAHQSHWRKD